MTSALVLDEGLAQHGDDGLQWSVRGRELAEGGAAGWLVKIGLRME